MLHRSARASVLIVLVAGLAGGASAHADPLVSGYGGPGGADQSVLGSTLLPGGGGGGGGAGGGGSDSERTSIRATSAPAVPGLTQAPRSGSRTTAAARPGGSRSGQGRSSAGRPSANAPTKARTQAGPPATRQAPRALAPATNTGANTSAGALPVPGSDLLIALAIAAGLGLAAFASARLARSQPTSA